MALDPERALTLCALYQVELGKSHSREAELEPLLEELRAIQLQAQRDRTLALPPALASAVDR